MFTSLRRSWFKLFRASSLVAPALKGLDSSCRPSVYRAEPLEPRCLLSAFYTFDVVAQQVGVINDLYQDPAINDLGDVAFPAFLTTNRHALYVQHNATRTNVAPTSGGYFDRPELGNDGRLINRRYDGGLAGDPLFSYNVGNPGVQTLIARGDPNPNASPFWHMSSIFRSNNVGQAAFYAQQLSGVWVTATGANGVYNILPGFQVMGIADDHRVLVIGTGSNPEIRLYDYDLNPGSAETIAEVDPFLFSTLATNAAISDDGSVIVFYGNLTETGAATITASNGDHIPVPVTPGRGIFASVKLGTSRYILRVAGETGNGEVDPGERLNLTTGLDTGPDFNFDGTADWAIGANSFATTLQRIDASSLKPFSAPARGSYLNVVYTANDAMVAGAPRALYSSRINLFTNGQADMFVKAGVEAPVQVVKNGDSIAGLGAIDISGSAGGSVNAFGTVVFFANGSAIIRATLVPIDQVHGFGHFDPDSPLVEYVVSSSKFHSRGSTKVNQVIMHATGATEYSALRTLTEVPLGESSVHYLISREGRVTQIVPEYLAAEHAKPSNSNSIGIELVDDFNQVNGSGTGHIENPNWLTPVQRRKAALLVRDISRRSVNLTLPPVFAVGGIARQHLVGVNGPYTEGNHEAKVPFDMGITPDRSGISPVQTGILAHGQVLNRTKFRTDPQHFNWIEFMNLVNLGIGLTLHSPANLFVTDSQGRRVGVDPISGQTYNEIPGAEFSGAGTEPQSVTIPDALEGNYAVQVVGTGSGAYRLDLIATGGDGGLKSTSVGGAIVPSAVTNYSLQYNRDDGASSSVVGTGNLPPVANDDTANVLTEQSAPVTVLANDSDPDGSLNTQSLTIVSPAAHGMASIDLSTGQINYASNAGYFGTDTITYTVTDNLGMQSNIATITVTVKRVTAPPAAANDTGTTLSGIPLVIDVLANDSDSDGTIDPTTVGIPEFGDPASGSLSVDPASGQITYTSDPGFFGTDSFIYTVQDDAGTVSNEATVTVSVIGAFLWDGGPTGNGTDWNDPINWGGDVMPGGNDNVYISLAGNPTISITQTATVRSLITDEIISINGTLNLAATSQFNAAVMLNGTVNGAGDATFRSTLSWTGGTMSGSGTTIIADGGTLNVTGERAMNRPLVNNGLVVSNGPLSILAGGSATGTFSVPGPEAISFVVFSGASFNFQSGSAITGTGDAIFSGNQTVNGAINVGRLFVNGTGSVVTFNNSVTTAASLVVLETASATFNGPTTPNNIGMQGSPVGTFNTSFTTNVLDLAGGTFTGAGEITLTGAGNSWSGGTMTGSARTIIASGATLNVTGIGAKVIDRTLEINGQANLAAGGDKVLVLKSLTMGGSGKLNLNDNAMIVDYDVVSPISTIRSLLTSGYAGGAWNGNGIMSSVAAATANRALGFAEATDVFTSFPATFAGQSIDGTSVLVRFTLPGDANLDRTVDIRDLRLLASNYGQGNRRWSQGDFTFDQLTGTADHTSLARNWQATLPQPAPPVPTSAIARAPRRTPVRALTVIE